jgi:hypothetical protein
MKITLPSGADHEPGRLGRFTRMSPPEPSEEKRDCSLPPGCKDLLDAIHGQPEPVPISLPPITREVILPDVVAVRYLAELLHLSPEDAAKVSGYFDGRSVPFERAQRILRRYGIWAERRRNAT